jgi:hypothetical protein
MLYLLQSQLPKITVAVKNERLIYKLRCKFSLFIVEERRFCQFILGENATLPAERAVGKRDQRAKVDRQCVSVSWLVSSTATLAAVPLDVTGIHDQTEDTEWQPAGRGS